MIIVCSQEIRESLQSKGNQDESESESSVSISDAEVDILGDTDEEKSDSESTTSKESCIRQKSNNTSLGSNLTSHKCAYKGCGKSFKSPTLLTQHTHKHTIEVSTTLLLLCCIMKWQ